MDARLEVGKWIADHGVLWFDSDKLSYRVPPPGTDRMASDGGFPHPAQTEGSFRQYQPERPMRLDPAAEYRPRHPVHRRFEVYAQLNPGASAVKCGQTELTYGELDAQADGFASLLQKNGIQPGDFCALSMAPSVAMVRAMMGVLKAGGAYFLLEPTLPADAVAAILRMSNSTTIIIQEKNADRFTAANARIVLCDDDADGIPYSWPQEYAIKELSPACASCAFSPAGSVSFAVSAHATLEHRLDSMQQIVPLCQGDSVLRNLDDVPGAFAWQLLWPLSHGARLVMASPQEEGDPQRLRQLIAREHVTVMHAAASSLQRLFGGSSREDLRPLRALLCQPLTDCSQPGHGSTESP